MEVDVDPLSMLVVEKFTLRDVAVAAERVYEGCPVRLEYPQRGGRVPAKVERLEARGRVAESGGGGVKGM